jgi:hypothetical protein
MRAALTLILALSFLASDISAQNRPQIDINLNKATFVQFVNAVEAQSDYRFYYKPVWTDSLSISIQVSNQQIQNVLDDIFIGTELNYAIDADHAVYITKGRKILSELAPDYFNENKPSVTAESTFDFSEYERKEKQKKAVEQKLYSIGNRSANLQGNATVAGNVRNITSGEPVIGAVVFVENPTVGVTTDQFGYYALTLPKGKHELKIKSVGMNATQRSIMLYSNGRLDIEMLEEVTPLKEVVIEADQDMRVKGIQMGLEKLDIKTMKQIPLALGETDIMKVVLTLPGVQSVGEGTVGLNVRGGATNQNLILFNDAVVYSPSHLFGFFSTFNPDVLQNVELYKSGISAEFGGRLSSVLDVHTREGNTKKFSGSGGISPITGRLTLEGPIVKDKTSFILGLRSTYSDWLLKRLNSKELRNSEASFYDITAQLTHKINDNNSLYLSAYRSHDDFRLNSDTVYAYSDQNASLKWKHVFKNNLYGVVTTGFSEYAYHISSDEFPINAFTMDFKIQQVNAKAELNYFPNSKHTINGGITTARYQINAGQMKPKGPESLIAPDDVSDEQGLESSIYAGDSYEINQNLLLYLGVRYSLYQYLGPHDVYRYTSGLSRERGTIIDTVHYNSGKAIAHYGGFEPRFSLRYSLSKNASVKISYNRMRQYIQMLSNTTAITPTDIWKLSDSHIKPQTGDQISIGFYKNLKGGLIEMSLESYYKTMQNSLDYKGGAVLLMNHQIETDVVDAVGKAYGIEWMIKKSAGKLNGWITYTYSRSFLKTTSQLGSETVNNGEYYPSNYDKPHAMNFIGNYKFSRRFNFSLNVIYNTGRPITLPIAVYELNGANRVLYSDRNQYRIPDYFRTDISINIEGNHKVKKLAHSSWTVAVYNLTGRANAYSVFFVSEDTAIKGYKLSVFARPIPTIAYNFRF